MSKLLQINSVVNFGSTGRIVEEIGQIAIASGWESYVAYGRHDRPSKSHKILIGNELDIKWHGLETRFFDNHGLASRSATKRFIKHLLELKPDIIHLHNLHGYYLNIQILFNYLSSSNIPVVWTLHDCWSFTGHCSHFEYIGCEKWKNQCFECPQKDRYPKSYVDGSISNYKLKSKIFNQVKNITFVPVSYWLGEELKKSFLKEYPLQVINNGIDLNIFRPDDESKKKIKEKYGILQEYIVLGVASIWEERKGLEFFIELSKKLPNSYKIVLVGLTTKQLEKLPSNILGVSRTENLKELAEFYSTANVFVNPTLEDTFPTTNLEALACGTPIITFKTGGSTESVCDKTGFVVNKGDVNELIDKVLKICIKGKDKYKEQCRLKAERHYNKEDRFNEYMQLYKSLLNKNYIT